MNDQRREGGRGEGAGTVDMRRLFDVLPFPSFLPSIPPSLSHQLVRVFVHFVPKEVADGAWGYTAPMLLDKNLAVWYARAGGSEGGRARGEEMNVDGGDVAPVLLNAHDIHDQSEGVRRNAADGRICSPGTPRRPPSKPPPLPSFFPPSHPSSLPVLVQDEEGVQHSWHYMLESLGPPLLALVSLVLVCLELLDRVCTGDGGRERGR